jgi:hypothetical protein
MFLKERTALRFVSNFVSRIVVNPDDTGAYRASCFQKSAQGPANRRSDWAQNQAHCEKQQKTASCSEAVK